MSPTTANNHDPALTHPGPNAPTSSQPSQPPTGIQANMQPTDLANVPLAGLDQQQIINLLRHLPQVFNKLTEQGKEDAAQTLSNLAQASPFAAQPPPHPGPSPTQQSSLVYATGPGIPGINDPGPSSHPRGPPNLGQLSAVAMQAAPAGLVAGQLPHPHPPAQQAQIPAVSIPSQHEEGGTEDEDGKETVQGGSPNNPSGGASATTTSAGGRRGARSAAMGSDEWARQRKDNHKEVERRRRGNINEGINELGRIVPNGNGEKAKGAILARAVQYIHHLKENEARNIEKWTLEKLLMDQAMSDLQAQLEEMKRLWDEERMAKQRAESELELLRSMHGIAAAANAGAVSNNPPAPAPNEGGEQSTKRRNEDTEATGTQGGEREGKKARTE